MDHERDFIAAKVDSVFSYPQLALCLKLPSCEQVQRAPVYFHPCCRRSKWASSQYSSPASLLAFQRFSMRFSISLSVLNGGHWQSLLIHGREEAPSCLNSRIIGISQSDSFELLAPRGRTQLSSDTLFEILSAKFLSTSKSVCVFDGLVPHYAFPLFWRESRMGLVQSGISDIRSASAMLG
jgi:hypothetical protein